MNQLSPIRKIFLRIALAFVCLFAAGTATAKPLDSRQIDCLTRNAYFESRGEPEKGQLAVIFTTLNRTKHPDFPSDVCKVVYQPKQFSWTNSSGNKQVRDREAYNAIKTLVKEVVQGKHPDVSRGATYFHANNIKKPKWANKMDCTARIGDHVFYKP